MADNSKSQVQQLMSPSPPKFEEYSGEGEIDLESTVEGLNNEEHVIEHEDPLIILVAKCVIESIKDVELLKKCRLVNKYWNYEACASLRKWSTPMLCNQYCNIEDFLSVLADGLTLSLPSAFNKIAVIVNPGVEGLDRFLTLIHRSGLEVRSLSISLEEYDLQFGDIAEFLKSKQTEITELNFINCPTLAQIREAFDQVRLSSLQALTFDATYYSSFSDEILNVLIQRGSRLSTLKIPGSPTGFQWLFSLDLSRIKKLYLEVYSLPKHCWDALTTLHLPVLANLTFDSSFQPEQLYSFIRNVSPTLESLQSNCFVVGKADIFFPKLKELNMNLDSEFIDLRKVIHDNFPRLETLKIERVYFDGSSTKVGVPHEGVKKLSVQISGVESGCGCDYPVQQFVINLKNKFPNVQDFEIDIDRNFSYEVESLLHLYHAYPLLKRLRMYTDVHVAHLAGATIEELDVEWPVQNFPRWVSIMDFLNLETLEIDRISNQLIKHCLSRIPNLKYLTIFWNDDYDDVISAEFMRDYLQHLIVLEICVWKGKYLKQQQINRILAANPLAANLHQNSSK